MYDFLNAIGGMGFAILGAALTVGLCCVGSAKGTGLVGEAAAGLVSEDPDKSTKCRHRRLALRQVPGPCGRRLRGYRGQAPGGRHQGPDLLRYRGILRYFVPGGYHHAGYQHSVKRSRP